MKFVKMHGSGNDYVYVDCFMEKIEDPGALAGSISDRHKGVGSDGLVLVMPSDKADFRMRMFNPDGSEAQMCGNASRCVGKYVYDYGHTSETSLTLETGAGIKTLTLFPENGKVLKVTVDMGEPVLKPSLVPVALEGKSVVARKVDFGPEVYEVTCVSTGNPHCVVFTAGVRDMDIEVIGRKIEHSPIFPERTNVEFVEVLSPDLAFMRVWERGTGETQACGTGACATLVAGVLNGILDRKGTISLLGGDLEIEWRESDGHIYMTGDAVTVYEGTLL